MDIRRYITKYWNYIAAQKREELRMYFHDNASIRWHETNELFNVNDFLRVNCDYPGSWNSEVERIEQQGETLITVTRVWSKDSSFHVTSFFKMEDHRIMELDEYWGEDGQAPQWRIDMNIGKPIR